MVMGRYDAMSTAVLSVASVDQQNTVVIAEESSDVARIYLRSRHQ